MSRLKPIEWIEVEPGTFRAINYGIKFHVTGWRCYRWVKDAFYPMGTDNTLVEAKRTCARHRRVNRATARRGLGQ